MKLTKAMREYVENKVREQEEALLAKLEEDYADYNAAKRDAKVELRRICEEMNAGFKKSLEEKGILSSTDWSPISYSAWGIGNPEVEKEIYEKKTEIKKNTEIKLRNLLLEIELGAAKSEFFDIVNNFKLEV